MAEVHRLLNHHGITRWRFCLARDMLTALPPDPSPEGRGEMMVEKSDRSAGASGVGHRLLSPFQRSARSDEFKKTLLLELKTGR